MTKEQLAEEYLDSKYHPVSQQRDNARKAYLEGFEAAEPKWISVNDELPNEQFLGNDFLVLVLSANGTSYQIAEWTDFDEEDNPFFQIEQAWCGQQIIERTVTHWMLLPKLPNNE